MRLITGSVVIVLAFASLPASAFGLNDLLKQGEQLIKSNTSAEPSQSTSSIDSRQLTDGLKEALKVGGTRAIEGLSMDGGYLNSDDVRIPLPSGLSQISGTLKRFGLSSQVEAFERSMNRAAEQAVGEATSLFIDTINQMTLEDAQAIYSGGDTAATDYFRTKTSGQLIARMQPLVEQAMDRAEVTRYYSLLMDQVSKALPMIGASTPDLSQHVTDAATQGLFVRLANEERLIRQNPAARSTELLKSVFGR
ncbi:MAG TPA: DUF4197 domain-containing protein [Marinobacterium sp.]|nr:DUF4197 domain-containing protein [Marinobacterium sp.]